MLPHAGDNGKIIACDTPWNQIQSVYKGSTDEHNEKLEIHQAFKQS